MPLKYFSELLLIVIGILLVAPQAYKVMNPAPALTYDEAVRAVRPLVRLKILGQDSVPLSVRLKLPQDPQWHNIESMLGPPEYLIGFTSVAKQDELACFEQLGMKVTASNGQNKLPLAPLTGTPYSWSSKCKVSGLKGSIPKGANVLIEVAPCIKRIAAELEIVVIPIWSSVIKDQIVKASMAGSKRRICTSAAVLGVCLMGIAVFSLRKKE